MKGEKKNERDRGEELEGPLHIEEFDQRKEYAQTSLVKKERNGRSVKAIVDQENEKMAGRRSEQGSEYVSLEEGGDENPSKWRKKVTADSKGDRGVREVCTNAPKKKEKD